jgi:hypothetical protein
VEHRHQVHSTEDPPAHGVHEAMSPCRFMPSVRHCTCIKYRLVNWSNNPQGCSRCYRCRRGRATKRAGLSGSGRQVLTAAAVQAATERLQDTWHKYMLSLCTGASGIDQVHSDQQGHRQRLVQYHIVKGWHPLVSIPPVQSPVACMPVHCNHSNLSHHARGACVVSCAGLASAGTFTS